MDQNQGDNLSGSLNLSLRTKQLLLMEKIEETEGIPNVPNSPRNMEEASTGPVKRNSAKVTPMMSSAKSKAERQAELRESFKKTASTVGKARAAVGLFRDELKTMDECLLYKTLKPLIICMKLTGLFFIRPKGQKLSNSSIGAIYKKLTPWQLYSVLICLLLLGNVVRSVFAFSGDDEFGYILFFKLLWCLFWVECLMRSILATWMCWKKKKGLQELVMALDPICYSDGIIPYERSLKRTMYYFITFSIILVSANVGMTAYGFFGSESLQQLFFIHLVPITPHYPPLIILSGKIVVLLMIFFVSMIAAFSLSFFGIFCYVLYKEFEYLGRTFEMKIRDDGSFADDLEKFRIMHQKRCKLVEDTDSLFKYYIANTYSIDVPLLCLLLYNSVYAEQDIGLRIIGAFWLVVITIQMMLVSVAATLVNTEAHAPLANIYSIRVHATTSERQLEVNMFLNKLTGTSIGLTAWDMFVINKPTILTVVGMILTYFFLMVQFKNPLSSGSLCTCIFHGDNGTEVTVPPA